MNEEPRAPIVVPPLDIEVIAKELEARKEDVHRQLKALEDAKKVSRKTMETVIGPLPRRPMDFRVHLEALLAGSRMLANALPRDPHPE